MSFFACFDDDLATDVSVFTEKIVFTSGEQAVMTGRVLAQAEVAVEDHGFQVDLEENFSNPTVISLGEKSIPGRFVGQIDQLDIRLDYFCRSFIVSKGETILGNVLKFSTLSPRAVDFSPKEGKQNNNIVVEGRNLTSDTKVLWDDQVIVPDNITGETFVAFKIPAMTDKPFIEIRLVSQGDTLTLEDPFEYIIGVWTEVGPLGDPFKNSQHVYFEKEDDFIYGLGLAQQNLSTLFHILDKNSLQKIIINHPGTPAVGAFFNETYFGGGSVNRVFNDVDPLELSTQFWKYENQDFVRLEDVPASLYKAVALVADNKVYLYGGEKSNRVRNNIVFVYDIDTDTWNNFSISLILPLNPFPSFHIEGHNYFVTEDGKTHRHDYLNDSWDTVDDFLVVPEEGGISIPINDKVYVGMQDTDRTVYAFRPSDGTWRTKASISNNIAFNTIGGWTNNDLLYVARTEQGVPINRILWSLDPDAF